MAFSWTENISVGASIDSADIVEIRTNVDTVDDEKCSGHDDGVDSSYDSGVDNDENTGVNSDDDSSALVLYNSGFCASNDSSDNATHDGEICNVHDLLG